MSRQARHVTCLGGSLKATTPGTGGHKMKMKMMIASNGHAALTSGLTLPTSHMDEQTKAGWRSDPLEPIGPWPCVLHVQYRIIVLSQYFSSPSHASLGWPTCQGSSATVGSLAWLPGCSALVPERAAGLKQATALLPRGQEGVRRSSLAYRAAFSKLKCAKYRRSCTSRVAAVTSQANRSRARFRS
ncbi:predicted protein [Pyrenophora tritici-repentis Pt-1C-BFP]|uniref:Uncharacterized protein n=1 Tax=Pyrenophora tritici-repentis (strain Pt-1C-BFP) TaxID=426418 RepID=B2WAA5_PYRTR|nr:uncharacterized protein PTRG_07218 [Pyrenophora tritici-repentis Pt-1C-BFP]EDU50137.1 predicted protein [Pyrenophora tritici-repentis Pt-1C-BFP]